MSTCFCIGEDCPGYNKCFPREGTTFIGGPLGICIPPTIPGSSHTRWYYDDTNSTSTGISPKPKAPERVEVDLCVTCKFFKAPDGPRVFPVGDRIGECRRNPPIGDRQWPKVGGADECGEWKRRHP